MVYARQVKDLRELQDSSLSLTAHCFQQWVDKDHEARVIVVGEEVFAVAIRTDSEAGHIDWRSDYASHEYEVVEPPWELPAPQ